MQVEQPLKSPFEVVQSEQMPQGATHTPGEEQGAVVAPIDLVKPVSGSHVGWDPLDESW